MKSQCVLRMLALVLATVATHTTAQTTDHTVTGRGADYKVLQKTTLENGTNRIQKYTELAGGLNYTNASGQWVESKEEITILPQGGAAALQGRHKVYFPSDIYNGVLEVVTPDGKHLKSRPLGVSYDDGSNVVWIARLKPSTGLLVSSNKVLYPDAFKGVKADLVLTYRRNGFESDLVFRQSPPAPHAYGLDDASSTLQLFTEFFNTAEPHQIPADDDPDYGISDTTLKFGKMTMIRGRAFIVGQQATNAVAVYKSWFHAEGRTFLVEQLPLEYLADELRTLPPATNILTAQITKDPVLYVAQSKRQYPPAHKIFKDSAPMLTASVDLDKQPGVVLDYNVINTDQSDFTFLVGATYYISGGVVLSGTTTIQGGAVIKVSNALDGETYYYDPASGVGNGVLSCEQINCETAPFRPAIFTSMDDDSVGEPISGSSGSPSTLNLTFLAQDTSYWYDPHIFKNLRFSYANVAVLQPSFNTPSFENCQFLHCNMGFAGYGGIATFKNCLFAGGIGIQLAEFGDTITLENVTMDNSVYNIQTPEVDYGYLPEWAYSATTLNVTNSLFAGAQSLSTFASVLSGLGGTVNANANADVSSGDFQPVVGGNYYLAASSPYRNAGTVGIDPDLLADLQTKTTYPPIVLTGLNLTSDIAFGPQVQRDTDTPDLGYHYAPIDYALGGVSLKGATATVYPGTVIAAFGTTNRPYGLNLESGAKFICKGLATNWNRMIAGNTVQEGLTMPMNGLITDDSGDASTLLDCRFTDWSVLALDTAHLAISNHTAVILRDCQFHSGSLFLDYPEFGNTSIGSELPLIASDPALRNCLLERVNVVLNVADDSPSYVQNNLFVGGSFDYKPIAGYAEAQNNLFDRTVIPDNSSVSGIYLGGFNAFVTNYNRLQPTSTNDLILTNAVAYQTGPLGKYYQLASSPLINAGSTNANANAVGLYDYTVLTNLVSGRQIRETNSLVDIGYHYVAVNSYGTPLDVDTNGVSNTNGIPDYLENSSTETIPDWWEWKYFGNLVQLANVDYDADGTNILAEYATGVDPNKISFSFSVPSQYVTTNTVTASLTVFSGIPSSVAVLVDTNNFSGAIWTNYTSSNVTVNLGTNQGSHDVWIGLRGLPTDAQQTWLETTVVLDSVPPSITIASPTNNSPFNLARINVRGNFTASSQKQITVNGVLAFTSGTNFNALNVPLEVGTNTITALVECLTGKTNVSSITVIANTNAAGILADPVQLTADPVGGFTPLPVTFTVQTNLPGTLQQVLYDFNGDDVIDWVTNNLQSISHTYTNGEYFPVVTIQTTAGWFSSSGGWNSFDPNRLRINVQAAAVVLSTISIANPVDIQWTATSNLYVLSGSTATITEFDASTNVVRSLSSIGSNPSGLGVDAAGNVYVAMTASNQVWKFKPTTGSFIADTNFGVGGYIGLTNGNTGTNTSEFNAPFDVAVSPDGGGISVSDSGNHRIQFFNTNGLFQSSFGSQGTNTGQFNTPKGVSYDGVGYLYIVDSGNDRITIANGETVLGTSGGAGTALGEFQGAVNLGVGARGIYVGETNNQRVQVFEPVRKLKGLSPTPFIPRLELSGQFSPALNQPRAIAPTKDLLVERMYIADTGNDRVIQVALPENSVPDDAWTTMSTNIVANGDMVAAVSGFSKASRDSYHEAFLCIGMIKLKADLDGIGALTPVFISGDKAQSYFERSIGGQTVLFPVEFVKENGEWKIQGF